MYISPQDRNSTFDELTTTSNFGNSYVCLSMYLLYWLTYGVGIGASNVIWVAFDESTMCS